MSPIGEPFPRVETYAGLAEVIRRRPARLGAVRLIAVDGPSGSGKSTFAARLAAALDGRPARTGRCDTSAVVSTDDLLDGWADQFTFWPRLSAAVLEPIRQDRPGEYPVYDWTAGRFRGRRTVPVPDVLIIEGVSTARRDVLADLSLSVFVTADADTRVRRTLARDGPTVEIPLRSWIAAEERHFRSDGTAERADRLVDGAPRLGHDPESEYVRYTDLSARSTADHAPLT